MENAKFYLESRKDKEGNPITTNVPVRMSFHFGGKRLEYYTGVRISNTKNFSKDYFKIGKSPVKANEPEASRINKRLKDLRSRAEQIHDNLIALGQTPTVELIKEKLDEQFKDKRVSTGEVLVNDAFIEFLDSVKKSKAFNTWKKFNSTYNHFKSVFGKQANKLKFEEIDSSFVEKFKEGIISQGFKEGDERKEYRNNSVVKYLKCFKEFLSWCKNEKREYYSGNAKFEGIKENEIDVIYLTEQEMEQFANTKMPNEALGRVQDVFLFGYYTSLRYSDLKKLKKVNVGGDFIRFYIAKGTHTTWHEVPLVEQAKAILDKYADSKGEDALPVLTNQKMNHYIKVCMKEAGLNKIVPLRHFKADGTFEEKEYELWELVTCHTSRKSFISQAVDRGIQEAEIKSLTGHSKNSRAFTRYYEISNEKKKRDMNKIFSKKVEPVHKSSQRLRSSK
jgi:integrase